MRANKNTYKTVVLASFLLAFPLCDNDFVVGIAPKDIPAELAFNVESARVELDEFGIASEAFNKESGYFNRRESVYTLLESKGMDKLEIHRVAQAVKDHFDTRKIYPRQRYFFYYPKEATSTSQPSKIIFEKDEQAYVEVNLGESISVREGSREIFIRQRIYEGTIDRSLYHTFIDKGYPYSLMTKMKQVFDWKIDFSRLRKGDHFRVIAEEMVVGDQVIGLGDLLACEFNHRGDTQSAFLYKEGESSKYYDEEGHSLQQIILKAPVKYTRISSSFTYSRYHPILKRRMPHLGIDYAAPSGTPVVSAGDGEIVSLGYKSNNGNYIKIRHNGTYKTAYLHLKGFAKGMKVGSKVTQGEVIGYVGSTGRSTGPHLDYRVYKDGKAVNPLTLEAPSAANLDATKMKDFTFRVANYKEKLTDLVTNY